MRDFLGKTMNPYGLMADLHLHAWSAFAHTTPSGQNSRLVGLLDEIRRCAKEVAELKGNTVIMAGDIFHSRGSVQPTVLNAVRDTLRDIYSLTGVGFTIIPGNHDLEGKNTTRLSSAVTALEGLGVTVANHTAGLDLMNVFLVPWVEDITELKKELEKLAVLDPGARDLILHAPVDGVIKGLPHSGLAPEYLAKLGFKRVFSGHYHNHKRFDGNVYSIGALAHHTWSDVGTKAGFLIVHPDRVDWRKSHLPEFIDLSQLIGLEPDEIPLLVDGNYVRIKVASAATKDVNNARSDLLEMGARGVIVQSEPKPPIREGESRPAASPAGSTLEESVKGFIATMPAVSVDDVTKAAFEVLAAADGE